MAAWLLVQANADTVRTTRVWWRWAAWMTLVSFELVQPPQPVVVRPLASFFRRFPLRSAPTLK